MGGSEEPGRRSFAPGIVVAPIEGRDQASRGWLVEELRTEYPARREAAIHPVDELADLLLELGDGLVGNPRGELVGQRPLSQLGQDVGPIILHRRHRVARKAIKVVKAPPSKLPAAAIANSLSHNTFPSNRMLVSRTRLPKLLFA